MVTIDSLVTNSSSTIGTSSCYSKGRTVALSHFDNVKALSKLVLDSGQLKYVSSVPILSVTVIYLDNSAYENSRGRHVQNLDVTPIYTFTCFTKAIHYFLISCSVFRLFFFFFWGDMSSLDTDVPRFIGPRRHDSVR